MAWRVPLLLGSATGVSVGWWTYLRFASGTDAGSLLGAEKIALELIVATSFFCLPRRRMESLLARLATWCQHRPRVTLVALLAGVYGVAWLTTPQIDYGVGAEGLGYGDDGALYGRMTEHFTWFETPAFPPFNYRSLAPLLVHASGFSTFTGFRMLNGASYVLSGLLVYGIARRYTTEPGRALLAVALFVVLKFGVKFWIYYPVLTDGLGTVLLLAAVLATVAGRRLAYLAVMALAVFCRENILVLMGFNVLFTLRARRDVRAVLSSLALQSVPIGLFVLSRLKPVFPPSGPHDDFAAALIFLQSFFFSPERQGRAVYAHLNALGVFLVLPLLHAGGFVRFLRAEYEWAYYLAANLLLLTIGGQDLDRFAYWQAPLLVVALTRLPWTKLQDAWFWLHVLVLHTVAMELFLWWRPGRDFYLTLSAAHARGVPFLYLEASCVLVVVIVAAMLARRPAT